MAEHTRSRASGANFLLALLWLGLWLGSAVEHAASAQPLYAPVDNFWMAPVARPLHFFGATDDRARWFIAQFGNPDALGAFQRSTAGSGAVSYRASSPTASVTVFPQGERTRYTLSQGGPDIPCDAQPHEFDLFAGVVESVDPKMPPAALNLDRLKTTTLAKMPALQLTARVGIDREWAVDGADRCDNNTVNVMAAVVLRNTVAKPMQVLYYQLSLYQYCAPGPRSDSCDAGRSKRFFWWAGLVDRDAGGHAIRDRFGYRDTLGSFDGERPKLGATVPISIDLKPRLLAVIASGPGDIDTNPEHWVLGGTYHGHSQFGKAGLASTWQDFGLSMGR